MPVFRWLALSRYTLARTIAVDWRAISSNGSCCSVVAWTGRRMPIKTTSWASARIAVWPLYYKHAVNQYTALIEKGLTSPRQASLWTYDTGRGTTKQSLESNVPNRSPIRNIFPL